jgi:hypothetical protein
VHTSTKHLPSYLSQQETFLQLAVAEFLEFLLPRECRIFQNLENFITHAAFWVGNEFIYKNPNDIASYF